MNRLLIVSNRLPVTIEASNGEVQIVSSSGGLATGMRGPHERSQGLWIGWPGNAADLNAQQKKVLREKLAEERLVPVRLTSREITQYYEGFSNGVIWPLFHYQLERIPTTTRDWDTYLSVNEKFAESVVAHYRPGDTIWVHDYQLMLLPQMIRQRLPDARVGFFLHIPFPSSDVFRILPWRQEVLTGMLGADLVGFHSFSYLRHFAHAAAWMLGAGFGLDHVTVHGKTTKLGVFPMGIDAMAFDSLSREPSIQERTKTIRSENRGHLFLGVDRLDYTKGLIRRLEAFDRLLEREPSLRDKVRLLQVAVPTRTSVREYARFRRDIEELVGGINGRHATIDNVPVHYMFQSFSERDLAALYCAADTMVVTPLRDGMNLVAKEFVACRRDEQGVLVLSEFAGAASQLGEALLVNPFNVGALATTLKQAIDMPKPEQQSRMRVLRERVFDYDVHRWASTFLDTLDEAHEERTRSSLAFTPVDTLDVLTRRLRSERPLVVLLDYDGTLVPFAGFPALAPPDPAVRELLRSMGEEPGIEVHIVSGRSSENLERWLGDLPIHLHAEHGLASRPKGETIWRVVRENDPAWMASVRSVLEDFTRWVPGSLVEQKAGSIAWHYRLSEVELGTRYAHELSLHLTEMLSNAPVEVIHGARVVEIRPQGVHKGLIVAAATAGRTDQPTLLALGDDRTDEDMFRALPSSSIAMHVGPGPSVAPYRLAGPTAARAFLESLISTRISVVNDMSLRC